MKLDFLSPGYFLCLALSVGFIVALFFAFRKCSLRVKKVVLLVLMLLNIAQHLLKSVVWPHYFSGGFVFAYHNTAYNICASLILVSPFVLLFGGQKLKDSLVYVGTAGPLLAIVVPFWFDGQPLWQWEVLRFYVCHVLLVATSILPALWGVTKISYKSFLFVPLFFFGLLILIVFNFLVCASLGLVAGKDDLFKALYDLNPCWVMHPAPPAGFAWVQTALERFTPSVFLATETRPYTPLLWYFIPMYLLMAILALLLGLAIDHKRFAEDCARLFRRKKD